MKEQTQISVYEHTGVRLSELKLELRKRGLKVYKREIVDFALNHFDIEQFIKARS